MRCQWGSGGLAKPRSARQHGRIMQSMGKIGYRWHDDAVERYLYLQPLEQPSERDWVDSVKRILGEYHFESIFMIIDLIGFTPVLTKTGFDEMIKHLQGLGLRKSSVALAMDIRSYEMVAKMFEVSSGSYGFNLTMRAFRALPDATHWLNEQMTGD